MAERLDSFPVIGRGGPRQGSKYDKYLDGGIYRLVIGEDIKSLAARPQLATLAKSRGLKLRTASEPNALVIQAYAPEEAE